MINIDLRSVVEGVRGIADDLITTDKERMELALQEKELDVRVAESQNDVNRVQAASEDKFASRARPFILWGCGFAVIYSALLEPVLRFMAIVLFSYTGEFPVINTDVLEFTMYGLLGLGSLRTVDKFKK